MYTRFASALSGFCKKDKFFVYGSTSVTERKTLTSILRSELFTELLTQIPLSWYASSSVGDLKGVFEAKASEQVAEAEKEEAEKPAIQDSANTLSAETLVKKGIVQITLYCWSVTSLSEEQTRVGYSISGEYNIDMEEGFDGLSLNRMQAEHFGRVAGDESVLEVTAEGADGSQVFTGETKQTTRCRGLFRKFVAAAKRRRNVKQPSKAK